MAGIAGKRAENTPAACFWRRAREGLRESGRRNESPIRVASLEPSENQRVQASKYAVPRHPVSMSLSCPAFQGAAYENALCAFSAQDFTTPTRRCDTKMPANKKSPASAGDFLLAGIAGLEPARAGVKVLCLNRLGYIPIRPFYFIITETECQRAIARAA